MRDIGELIQKLRHEENLRQTELAKKVNLGGNTARNNLVILERIEEGKKLPSEQQIWNLARFFNSSTLLARYFEVKGNGGIKELEDYYIVEGERYYSARQVWERWNMPMNGVSPYISELKTAGKIRAVKHKNKNLVHANDLMTVYDEIPEKHKTKESDHQLEIMMCDTPTKTETEITVDELAEQVKALQQKVKELEEQLNKSGGFLKRLFNWGGDK